MLQNINDSVNVGVVPLSDTWNDYSFWAKKGTCVTVAINVVFIFSLIGINMLLMIPRLGMDGF